MVVLKCNFKVSVYLGFKTKGNMIQCKPPVTIPETSKDFTLFFGYHESGGNSGSFRISETVIYCIVSRFHKLFKTGKEGFHCQLKFP